MGEFDELIEMGELVESIGENFPTPEEAAGELPKPTEVVVTDDDGEAHRMPVVDPEKNEDAAETQNETPEGGISIDRILGLEPGQKDDAAVPSDKPVADPKPEAGESSSIEARLSEQAEEIRRLKEQNDLLIKRELTRPDGDDVQPEGAPEGSELNPDVRAYFDQYGLVTRSELEEIRKAVAPIQQDRHSQELAGFIGKHVEGFTVDHMPKLYDELKGMSEEDKAFYGKEVAGAVLLAKELVGRGALTIGQKKRTEPNTLSNRHRTESGSSGHRGIEDMSEEAKVKALMDADPNDILRMIDNLEG